MFKKEVVYESKTKYSAASGMPGVERGGIQYPTHRPDGPAYLSVLNFLLSVLVFAVFQRFIFGKLVKKHTSRIISYLEERHFFLKFFDKKAFAIMAVMMTGGIGLRVSGLAPERFIAVFYTGLGAALLLAGLLFGRNFGKAVFAANQNMEEEGV